MEDASGKDLKLFFRQWLNQPRNPVIHATGAYNSSPKSVTIQVEQTANGNVLFAVTVEIGYYRDGSTV